MKDIITFNEILNDGQSIFLYYAPARDLYYAFGLSAYYADMATDPILSYSEELQMPVATLSKKNVLDLKQSMELTSPAHYSTYQFKTNKMIGETGYSEWMNHSIR